MTPKALIQLCAPHGTHGGTGGILIHIIADSDLNPSRTELGNEVYPNILVTS